MVFPSGQKWMEIVIDWMIWEIRLSSEEMRWIKMGFVLRVFGVGYRRTCVDIHENRIDKQLIRIQSQC